jgi:hypothetical protein
MVTLLLAIAFFATLSAFAILALSGAANAEGTNPQAQASAASAPQSASHDGAEAECALGETYGEGRGADRNDAMALKWYRISASHGFARAQYHLGVAYLEGRGVREDDAEALKWFRLAAEQGYADAERNLAYLYENGFGVAKNEIEAEKWRRLAAAHTRTGKAESAPARVIVIKEHPAEAEEAPSAEEPADAPFTRKRSHHAHEHQAHEHRSSERSHHSHHSHRSHSVTFRHYKRGGWSVKFSF